MWSATTESYVKQLVLTMRKEYPYYVAHTISGTSGNDTVTTKVYFSTEKIATTGLYSYNMPSGSVCYDLVTGNYSDRYDNVARVSTNAFSGNLNINRWEFVYTNAEFQSYTIQPDITAERGLTNETFQGFGFVLVGAMLVVFFSGWFTRRRNALI